MSNARSLEQLLVEAGLDARGYPPDVGTKVQTDLLFGEGAVSDRTFVLSSELARLSVPASLEDCPRLAAWEGFLRGLEQSGRAARLVIWLV